MKSLLRVSALVFFSSFVGCAGCGEHYSEGMRTGVLVKFSQKGVIWKSWEGQLNLGSVVPTVWEFSVTDPAVAEHLGKNVGKTFTIQYHQWAMGPVYQDSDYTARTVVLAAENGNEKK